MIGAAILLVLAMLVPGRVGAAPEPTPTPARVSVAGRPDPAFGTDGRVTETVSDVRFEAFALQPDGKIVVVGNRQADDAIVVRRYTTAGIPDATFGDGGRVVTDLPGVGHAEAVAVTASGEIVVAGSAYPELGDPHGSDLLVLRFTASGMLDAGFAGGAVILDVGVNGAGRAILVQGDRRVVVAGDSNASNIALPLGVAVMVGLRSDGELDPTFGEDGITRTEAPQLEGFIASGIVAEANGSIVSAVTAYSDIVEQRFVELTRFDENGHPLEPFDVGAGYASGLAIDARGRILASGGFFDDAHVSRAALTRWLPNGRRDDRLGTLRLAELADSLPSIVVDRDDRIVLASDVLSRRMADGSLDDDFGSAGVATGPAPNGFRGLALQGDGKIVAVGSTCDFLGCTNVLARYEDRTRLCGDADASGTFTVSDGVAALRAAAGLASTCTVAVCDADGDGAVGVTDAVSVLRAAAELPAALACGLP